MSPASAALLLALVGGVIAIPSAIEALLTVGGDPAYAARLGVGWAALGLAVLATGAGALVRTRPRTAAILALLAGIAGAIAINLFYINTFYVLALPFWLFAAVVALFASFRQG